MTFEILTSCTFCGFLILLFLIPWAPPPWPLPQDADYIPFSQPQSQLQALAQLPAQALAQPHVHAVAQAQPHAQAVTQPHVHALARARSHSVEIQVQL